MKKFTRTLAILLVGLDAASAQEAADATDAEANGPRPAENPPIELKNKSSFAIEDTQRNPFWPVGWRPANKASAQTTETASGEISPASFLVSSITVDTGGRFAIINGKVMNEGQVFGLQVGNQTYQLTVKAIQDGQVVLGRRDQEIIVPLRRR
jgi:hypothetical protein